MRASLLAAGCLDGPEREATLHHLEACAGCRREHDEAALVLAMISQDPVRDAETPVAVEFLVKRVVAHLDQGHRARGYRIGSWAYSLAVVGALLVVVPLVSPVAVWVMARLDSQPATGSPVARVEAVVMDSNALDRLDRRLAREQAVSYLNEAQDVLVTMASAKHACPDKRGHVEVAAEARRSRELLARRTLLVEMEDDGLAQARPVLQDVEYVLRAVAALESCAKGGDVERVRREVERRRLLMKIRLMSRELVG